MSDEMTLRLGVADLKSRMLDMAESLRDCGPETKPMLGGVFGSGNFVLGSILAKERGLHGVLYFVADHTLTVALSMSRDRIEAIQLARQMMSWLSPQEIAAAVALRAEFDLRDQHQKQAYWREYSRQERAKQPSGSVPRRRLRIFNKSEGKCHYCAAPLDLNGKWHIEHKMPRALMGGNEDENLVASCVPCNAKKRDKTDLEFIAEQKAKAA